MIKLGIDLHGVIDSDVYKFKNYLLASRDIGTIVYIISGPHVEFIKKELSEYRIWDDQHYNEVFSVVDHLREMGVPMWEDSKGRPWASEEDWWKSKAEICEMHEIDIMIDDSEKYQPYFNFIPTQFILYKP
jgi:hypothetical protein